MSYIAFFEELGTPELRLVGGKGANLGILASKGFPVPRGFCLTCDGYWDYIHHNGLASVLTHDPEIDRIEDFGLLEDVSARIRQVFSQGVMPDAVRSELFAAYGKLCPQMQPVAVRSSATAEDLPGMSFAGQQDTFLNIMGAEALVKAVIDCWSSLWTARAIGYRNRNGVPHQDAALCVVIQTMIQSEISGVMFTANPMNGRRRQVVIDAAFGLGEALVSGQVEPDHYTVEDDRILEKKLGDKGLVVVSLADGGVEARVNEGGSFALTDKQILELAQWGRRIEEAYGFPQDIEWAYQGGDLHILQSRPVTSLFPTPYRYVPGDLENANNPTAYFSFAAWQVMLDPITPAGRDVLYTMAALIAKRIGIKVEVATQRAFATAGERLYANITPLIRNKIGRKIAPVFIQSIDPTAFMLLDDLLAKPEYEVLPGKLKISRVMGLLRTIPLVVFNVILNEAAPKRGLRRVRCKIDGVLERARQIFEQCRDYSDLVKLQEGPFRRICSRFMIYIPSAAASGLMPFQVLLRMTASLPGAERLIMELTRGQEGNVTTEMDLDLWRIADAIRKDGPSRSFIENLDAEAFSKSYLTRSLPEVAQETLSTFLDRYGARGIGEVDIGRERWGENPIHIIKTVKSYMTLNEASSPERIFERSAEQSAAAEVELLALLKASGYKGFKLHLCRFLIKRGKALGGLRETPKFALVRILKPLRDAMLRLGRRAVDEGLLDVPEDIFFLYRHEVSELGRDTGFQIKVAARKNLYDQEKKRHQIPHLLESDGTSYYEAAHSQADDGNGLCGSPVSAGVAEGRVRVVLDPHQTTLLPGEIMVCPATDPAWTPLFLLASGLVMEVGGLFTHGSVVAREYGIPAVVGIKKATEFLKTGQRVRVDGTTGVVEVLEAG